MINYSKFLTGEYILINHDLNVKIFLNQKVLHAKVFTPHKLLLLNKTQRDVVYIH